MMKSVTKFNPALKNFDVSVFTGNYVTGDIDDAYISRLEYLRSETMQRTKTPDGEESMGLHNNHISRK